MVRMLTFYQLVARFGAGGDEPMDGRAGNHLS
jgi:hypothetical protein